MAKDYTYMADGAWIATQSGIRPMTEQEKKEAIAYHMTIVNNAPIVESPEKADRASAAITGFLIATIAVLVKVIMFGF